MKKIFFYNQDAPNNGMFNPEVRDNCNEPYIRLKEKLEKLGYEVKTIEDDSLDGCEWIFFITAPAIIYYGGFKGKLRWLKHKIFGVNKNARLIYQECIDRGLKDRMVLFLWEGKSVSPQNYKKHILDGFQYIFTWNDDYVDNKKFFKFYLPSPENFQSKPAVDFRKKKLLANISINKNSPHPRELYSARRKTIRYFDKNYPNDFDLYGVNWNMPVRKIEKIFPWLVPHFSSYRGPVKNKMDVMPNYKFGLSYENLYGERGQVTEKIFDLMRAHIVPIYWGAENITDYVDKNAFIDRRMFKTEKELADFLVNMTEAEYNKYLSAIDKYLQSEKFKLFLSENFVNTIINKLQIKPA